MNPGRIPETLNSVSLKFISTLYCFYMEKERERGEVQERGGERKSAREIERLKHKIIFSETLINQVRERVLGEYVPTEKAWTNQPRKSDWSLKSTNVHQMRTISKIRIFKNIGPKLLYCLTSMCPDQKYGVQGKTSGVHFYGVHGVYQILKGTQERDN